MQYGHILEPSRPNAIPPTSPSLNSIKHLSRVVLELLDVKVLTAVLSVVSSVPVDLLDGVVTVSVNGEPGLAAVGEKTLVVDTESSEIAALGNGTRVRDGQANGGDLVLNNVQVLESSGDTVLSGVGDEAVGAATTD